jgi:hypothetical protein
VFQAWSQDLVHRFRGADCIGAASKEGDMNRVKSMYETPLGGQVCHSPKKASSAKEADKQGCHAKSLRRGHNYSST